MNAAIFQLSNLVRIRRTVVLRIKERNSGANINLRRGTKDMGKPGSSQKSMPTSACFFRQEHMQRRPSTLFILHTSTRKELAAINTDDIKVCMI